MENSRLLLAAFLSAVVLLVWNHYMVPPPVEEAPPGLEAPLAGEDPDAGGAAGIPDAGEEPAASTASAEPAGEEDTGAAEGALIAAPPPSLIDFGSDTVAADAENTVTLETDNARAVFTNKGAQLVSFELLSDLGPDGEPVEIIRSRGTDPYPFSLVVNGEQSHRLNKALFVWKEETDENGLPRLRFRHRSERGAAEKVFGWTPEGLLTSEITVDGRESWSVLLGPGLRRLNEGEAMKGSMMGGMTIRQGVYRQAGEVETLEAKKVEEDLLLSARAVDWAGLTDTYFLGVSLPLEGVSNVVIRPVQQRRTTPEGEPRFLPIGFETQEEVDPELMVLFEAGAPRMKLWTFYGSKQYDRLSSMPFGFEDTVQWGSIIGPIARFLYYCLDWIHENVTPNYGWAIVLTTILIKLVLLPLTFKGQMSMARMQELNPEVQKIRNKYRGKLKDKQGRPNMEASQAQNNEIMALYKKEGINPMGGCFPILLQMPVFFAFFRLLSTSVELRGAPFGLWVHDLAAPDPYYILPVLMTVTSIAMQKTMPSSPDPMQRRMMQMMPIMFGFFALAFPSGLVVYWVTNNIFSMIQQPIMTRFKKKQADARLSRNEA